MDLLRKFNLLIILILIICIKICPEADELKLRHIIDSEILNFNYNNFEQGARLPIFKFKTDAINDKWFAEDKYKHFILSAGMTIWTYQFLRFQKNKDHSRSRDISIGIVFGMGTLKELVDSTKKDNYFSYKDLTWDAAGILIAYFLYIKE